MHQTCHLGQPILCIFRHLECHLGRLQGACYGVTLRPPRRLLGPGNHPTLGKWVMVHPLVHVKDRLEIGLGPMIHFHPAHACMHRLLHVPQIKSILDSFMKPNVTSVPCCMLRLICCTNHSPRFPSLAVCMCVCMRMCVGACVCVYECV